MADDVTAQSIAEIQAKLAAGAEAQALVTPLWERARAVEPKLRAFAHLPEQAPAALTEGPLAGVTVGVKDLIDTADMPTDYGSAIYEGHQPAADAAIVAQLRALGATALGKTVTTEFAWRHPGATRNPWALDHTPGGSSSGSAAAVAAGIVTLALGTQTFGSVIRPAAFCGVVGFKPSFGQLPRDGVHPLSPSLDHVGLFARALEDVATAFALLKLDAAAAVAIAPRDLRIAALRPPSDVASAEQVALFDDACAQLRAAGAHVEAIDLTDALPRLLHVADTLMGFEAAGVFGELRARFPDKMSASMAAYVDAGKEISEIAHQEAVGAQQGFRMGVGERLEGYDALLTVPATGEAPLGLGHTGDPQFCVPWTTLGFPALSLPVGMSSAGLPLGLQLVGRFGEDRALLAAAQAFLEAFPLHVGRPALG
ncbi:amidase [Methylopila capsulata]|uniref:Amidase n=1 Tax=Methylopila capsulata TaxID=61654 RepID=A0A9W6IS62_9HYPH|nr:amidase [Methylopila capsulata]MBM7849918.1 amidase [Methylopila capsulata]GLK55208.1 amidase [Methylopila capsulata]